MFTENIWVILNSDGRIIESTIDPAHIEFMTKYVRDANSSGDDWSLIEYKLEVVLEGPYQILKNRKVRFKGE